MGRIFDFVVMVEYAWGRGDSLTLALENARKAAHKTKAQFKKMKKLAWHVPADITDCYIDSMGSLVWSHGTDEAAINVDSRPVRLPDEQIVMCLS